MKNDSFYSVDRIISQYNDSELGLSLLVNEKSFDFSIYVIKTKQVLALCAIPVIDIAQPAKQITAILASEPLLDFDYGEVKITLSTSKATIVPMDYFNTSFSHEYLQAVHEYDHVREKVLHDYCKPLKAAIVYSVDKQLAMAVEQRFPDAQWHSAYTILLQSFLALKKKDKRYQTQVFVHFRENEFDIVVFDKQELLFINSFKYKTQEELLYFFLYVLNKLNIDLGNVYLRIAGKATEEQVEMMDAQVFATEVVKDISGLLSNIQLNAGENFLLLNLILCE